MRLAENDMKVRTSLLDARFLCGDYPLYQDFEKRVESRLVKNGVKRFIREKLEENRARHERSSAARSICSSRGQRRGGRAEGYPNRSLDRGAKLKAKDLDALALNGVVSATDIAALKESQDFLLRVRNELAPFHR